MANNGGDFIMSELGEKKLISLVTRFGIRVQLQYQVLLKLTVTPVTAQHNGVIQSNFLKFHSC